MKTHSHQKYVGGEGMRQRAQSLPQPLIHKFDFANIGKNAASRFTGFLWRYFMNKRQKFARLAAFGAAAGAGSSAFAVDPATALEALGTLSTSATGFGPIMFGLAVTVTGIMIRVKWIKRGKGAA